MKIELLVFEGCPNAEPGRVLLRDCMVALGISQGITEVQVDTPELAKLMAFPGSPTLRVNDGDVDPGMGQAEGSLTCRTYWVGGQIQGLPDRAWVLESLRKAQEVESHACCTPITTPLGQAMCPFSGTKGKPVKPLTLRALLKPHLRDQVRDEVYRFCGDPTCEVVYFSANGAQSFVKNDLLVRVGIKETEAPRPLCYCFGHSVESIRDEYAATGECTAVEAIRAEVKAGTCRCEVTNPGGGCCLGDVIKATKEVRTREPETSPTAAGRTNEIAHACCAVPAVSTKLPTESSQNGGGRSRQRTTWAAVGLGLLASACCWLPLALAGVGAAGGAAGAKVAWLRPWSLGGLALLLLGLVGWWAFRRLAPARTDEDCCAVAPRFPTLSVVVLGLSFVSAWAAPRLIYRSANPSVSTGSLTPVGGTMLVLSTPRFDCPPCAGTLPETMAKTPGVASVQMDFDKRETRIRFQEGADVEGILATWNKNLGFSGKVIQHQP